VVWPQNHSDGFLSVWSSKSMVTVCEWFGLKTTRTVFAGMASKLMAMVSSGLASKLVATVFSSLASKLVATVSIGLASELAVSFFVDPQNQGDGGLPGLGLKTSSFGLVIWASKSRRWFFGLGLKTKQASVCRLRHKTDGWSVWDTR
jgi:predicted membrane protein